MEGLQPLVLLGGYNAEELWPTVNLCLLSWGLILLAPRWRLTPALTLVSPLVHAVMYTLALASIIFFPQEESSNTDMMTFEGVVTMFKDPTGVFGGWLHYCVYDPLIGRWIVMDSAKRGAGMTFHVLVMVLLLLLAMFIPLTGWLLYMGIVRPVLLPVPVTGTPVKSKNQ